ncbi:MAG: hypothetical protein U9Q88_00005 [Bacillota bacterium]|nr:hypothetical protein [Bacillota bacterium]
MKKYRYLVVFMILISMVVAGCSNSSDVKEVTDQGQTIEVQRLNGDGDKYEVFKVVTNEEQVNKGKKLLDDLRWEDAKVSMVRPADFRFSFPNPEAKVVLYELWIGPNMELAELVINAESKYVKLGTNESAELFELLTGKKLSDLE